MHYVDFGVIRWYCIILSGQDDQVLIRTAWEDHIVHFTEVKFNAGYKNTDLEMKLLNKHKETQLSNF